MQTLLYNVEKCRKGKNYMRLKELRKKEGISLKELGEILGVAESTVSLYENSKREASYSILHKAAEYFGVSIDYLLSDRESADPSIPYQINIPILETVSLCGNEIVCTFSEENESINLGNCENHFYYKMHDSSMAPQIDVGDICLIKKVGEIESGDFAAVIYGDNPVMLRRVIRNSSATVLSPLNPSFESIIVSDDEKITILGKLTQTIKNW